MLKVLERFTGRPDTGDIDTKDNYIVNVMYFAGLAVTVVLAAWMFMYWLL